MSEFREDLLVTKINKKRVVGIILVTALLIASFAFSILLSCLIFDSQRPFPSDELSGAEEEEGIELITAPFPFDFSDFQDLNLTQDLLESLLEMFDGNIDDLDLGDYSEALAALMFSEVEVFRVYDYEDFFSMNNKLWKYECFDEYSGEGWHSNADTTSYPFSNYDSSHWDKDLIRLKIPINPNTGVNSMVLPNLFPRPFIVEGSVNAPNLDYDSLDLYNNDFNCTTIDLNFYEGGDMNLSYELFGKNLPTNIEINNTAINAIYTPTSIKNKFLQLPTTVQTYLAENSYVYNDYLTLNGSISPNDNAFMVANKIRNYLQYQFSLPLDLESYTTAPEGRDVVDYFCETRQGLWSEFASAFCVFSRIFGVSSRFVDGFNSIGIEEIWDNYEFQTTFAIKYKNIYNWAEIYVPTNTNGDGDWVQMDIYYDQFGPIGDFNYSLTVETNFTAGFRNDQEALITATLSQGGSPVQGETITFIDLATDQNIGTIDTDFNGEASVIIPIDSSQVVGPHAILAYYNPQATNYTQYTIYGDIKVNLTNLNPSEIDLAETDLTYVEGFVEDPLNNLRVRGANLEFVLLDRGTNNRVGSPPFSGITIFDVETDLNGSFGLNLDIDPSVPEGQYEIRVDFNGTFYGLPLAVGVMNASSNRMDFNITRTLVKKIWFYINDVPSNIVTSPTITRWSNLRLKAYVLNETNGPIVGDVVDFYDFTDGSYIGSNSTNLNGFTTLDYFVGSQALSGPNLLYTKLGIVENYSYYILDELPTIRLISGPTPREVNRTGSIGTIFNIIGEITNAFDRFKKISHSEITIKLFRGAIDYSSYLIPYDSYPFETGDNGYFSLNFGVAPDTPIDNYSLRIDFYGIINLNSYPYPYSFNLAGLSNSTYAQFDLEVTSPPIFKFDFWINDYDNHNYYQPIINREGSVNLSIYLVDGTPLDGEDINFYDLTQDISIGTVQTINGRASLIYQMNSSTVAGPHLIYARWGSNYNYSYFTLNDNIVLDVLIGPDPNQINRGGETFNLQGTITDASNGSPIKFAEIYIALFDDTMTDVSYYLSSNWFYLDETGTFDFTLSVDSGTPTSNYTINVGFYGGFIYSFPNNQYNQFNFYFDIFTYSNFTSNDDANYELKVVDPDDVAIQFEIDGNPALSFYNDFNLPERYNKGDFINFSVYITQSGVPVDYGTVILTDVYINTQIGSYTFVPANNGRHYFIIDSTSWHAGLHRIRVQWESYPTTNNTYVIINDTISIAASSSLEAIQRDVNSFNVFGSVQDNSVGLRGLNIKILLLDSSLNDVSGYLDLAGSQYINLYDGNFQFDINSISINCPQGVYYFRIDFNGSISESGISLTDYMMNSSSFLVSVNITAGTYIVGNYETTFEGGFYEGDTLNAYGYLYWDNGTAVNGVTITITIEDGMGGIITTEIGFTDGSGWYNVSILIDSPDWPDETEVYASFDPEDSFIAPDYYYIESTFIELFRP